MSYRWDEMQGGPICLANVEMNYAAGWIICGNDGLIGATTQDGFRRFGFPDEDAAKRWLLERSRIDASEVVNG